jgi:hypothetical protein
MLLFGLTTVFLFAMIQKVWPLGSRGVGIGRPRARLLHRGIHVSASYLLFWNRKI